VILDKKLRFKSFYEQEQLKSKIPRHENVCGCGGIATQVLTSALEGCEWLDSRSARVFSGESDPQCPLYGRLDGP
jgi:hypothetical protein